MTDTACLTAIRDSYDTVAADYARLVKSPGELDPLSRAILAAFAEVVRVGGLGPVADLGCGPGKVTAYLAGLGLPVFGLDLSPRMVALAQRSRARRSRADGGNGRRPGPFAVGSMTALPVRDGALGGILAYYSTHHLPPELLPVVYAEFRRALAPGGTLMLAGHVGDGERVRPEQAYGHPVSYESHLLPSERIAQLLGEAGMLVTSRTEQAPEGGARRAVATFLARKPSGRPDHPE
ncbi:class I SAM-dependent methyltransferase [Streptomyces luteolus]|uniref:Methyltransferase domain-containing protein n=1 Tax=Streptomyces luteolus TaxID=3043615 RepID=A0ABT6T8H7_9ACTN|nr:class I SAM-dependent methyltransferase [Streptomyces sp. B-S-A12]MDI3424198.1 methyltransferase domain-containing protein [Streptomyces sp. B-S-A12]